MTSRRTWSACSTPARGSSTAHADGERDRRGADLPAAHRRAGAHAPRTPQLVCDAAGGGADPGGDQRRRATCSPPTAARDWLRLLEALERPASTIARPDRRGDAVPRLERRADRHARRSRNGRRCTAACTTGAAILRDSGVAALTEAIAVGEDLRRADAARAGRRAPPDRPATTSLSCCTARPRPSGSGSTALRGWLAERIADAGREDAEDERDAGGSSPTPRRSRC